MTLDGDATWKVILNHLIGSCICRHFTQNHECQPHGGGRGKVSGSPGFIIREPRWSLQKFVSIHWTDVEIWHGISGNFNLLELEDKGTPKSLWLLWAPWMSVQQFMAIHPTFVKIFQFRPQWWTQEWLKALHFLMSKSIKIYISFLAPQFPLWAFLVLLTLSIINKYWNQILQYSNSLLRLYLSVWDGS